MTDEKPAGVPIGVAIGGPVGVSGQCEVGDSVDMHTGSAPRIEPAPESGLYCINVIDTGSVKTKSGVAFAVTVTLK